MCPSAVVVPPLPPLPLPFGATFPAPPAPTVIVWGPGATVCKGALIGAGTAGSVEYRAPAPPPPPSRSPIVPLPPPPPPAIAKNSTLVIGDPVVLLKSPEVTNV